MRDIWIEIESKKVFGKTMGSGPLVLGLHGWSQRNGWHTWEPLIRPLAEAGFRVVSVDMPGWGQSPVMKNGPLTADEAVGVVREMIAALEAPVASLMGKSWGGGVALQIALDQPKCVDKLILTAPAFRHLGRLSEVRQPVLLAWAKDDNVIPIHHAREYMERIPEIQLETYESGGHSAAPKNANDFAAKAIEFLRD